MPCVGVGGWGDADDEDWDAVADDGGGGVASPQARGTCT